MHSGGTLNLHQQSSWSSSTRFAVKADYREVADFRTLAQDARAGHRGSPRPLDFRVHIVLERIHDGQHLNHCNDPAQFFTRAPSPSWSPH